MSLLWMEGFEADRIATRFAQKYATVAGTGTTVTGRKIGSAIRSLTLQFTTKPLRSSVTNVMTMGLGLYVTSISATPANQPVFEFRDAAGEQCNIRLIQSTDTTGAFMIEMRRGTNVLGTSASLPALQWMYLEFQATIRTSTNGDFEIRVNGVNVLSASGVNTASQGTDGADRVRWVWGTTTGSSIDLDDLYVLDSDGAVNNDFLGPRIVHGANPSTNGNRTQWTPSTGSSNVALIDEGPAVATDADYVSSNTTGLVDLYGFTAMATMAVGATVNGVQVNALAALLTSGTRSFSIIFRDTGGSEANSANATLTSTTATILSRIFEENPVTTSVWTRASINAGQIGVEDEG